MKPISVIMTCYNEKKQWVIQSINSILNQSYQNFELIIVLDNPENDELYELITNYSLKDNRVKVIKNEINLGLAESLNKAIKASKYDILARMDSDDICSTDRFEKQIEYLLNCDTDILGSNTYFINENEEIIDETKEFFSPEEIKKVLLYRNPIQHPTWMIKKEVFEKLNGYYPYKISEDYDFLLRATSLGYKIHNMEDKLVYYRLRTTSITNSARLNLLYTNRYLKQMHKKYPNQNYPNELVRNFILSSARNENLSKIILEIKNSDGKFNKLWISLKYMIISKDGRFYLIDWMTNKLKSRFLIN
ncbi:glycosyltransferase [Niallia sp. 01092]|uniref:glycosyltransferase n=1 Tax=Niallia sp. 01092 TaxID=3457759 RepID=UPI003FD061D1